MKVLADNLKKIQKEKGLRQVDLANELGIAQSSLSSYITNRKEPTIATVYQFAKRLGTSIGALCGENQSTFTPIEHTYGNVIEVINWLLSVRQSDGSRVFQIEFQDDAGCIRFNNAMLRIAMTSESQDIAKALMEVHV